MAGKFWHLVYSYPNKVVKKYVDITYNEHNGRVWIHITKCFEWNEYSEVLNVISLLLDKKELKDLINTLRDVYKEVYKEDI